MTFQTSIQMNQRLRSLLAMLSLVFLLFIVIEVLWGSGFNSPPLRKGGIEVLDSEIGRFEFNDLQENDISINTQETFSDLVTRTKQSSNHGVYDSVYKLQRDVLSRTLNDVKRQLGQLSCEMVGLKTTLNKTTSPVSMSGGWCRRDSKSTSGEHKFDKSLALELSYFFENQTVVSFGDGPGDYKRYLDSTQRLRKYDAYDGAPYSPETSGGAVKFLDLTAPQYGLPVYDWVISLEVAEHIPKEYESVYVDNLVRHARSGIVLSWAVPNQTGFGHVNNKALKDVQKMMSDNGFMTDIISSLTLQKKARLPWLVRNIYVYRRIEESNIDSNFS